MQNVVNKVKAAALGVADSLTPVLKVPNHRLARSTTRSVEYKNNAANIVAIGVQVQGVWDAYPGGVRVGWRPSGVSVPHLELVGWRAGQKESLPTTRQTVLSHKERYLL